MTHPQHNTGVLPVFKSAPVLTPAQQIDVWLTNMRNNVVYAFQDKRIDQKFYNEVYGLNQKPVTWAQKTENYLQETKLSFDQKIAHVKNSLQTMGAGFLQGLRQATCVGLATISTALTSFDAHSSKPKEKNKPPIDKTPTTTTDYNVKDLLFLKDFSIFKKTMDNSRLPDDFYSGDYLDKLKAMYAIQQKETPGPGATDTPWEGSSKKPSQVGAFGWGQFVATSAIAEGMFVKLKTISGGKNRAQKAEQLSREFAKDPEKTDMLALPLVGKTNKILIVKMSEELKTLMQSNNAMDLFSKENGLAAQHYYFAKHYQGILEKISRNFALQEHIGKIAQTPIGQLIINEHFISSMFWYQGPKATERKLDKAAKRSKTQLIDGAYHKVYKGVTNAYFTDHLQKVGPNTKSNQFTSSEDTTRIMRPHKFKDLELFKSVSQDTLRKPPAKTTAAPIEASPTSALPPTQLKAAPQTSVFGEFNKALEAAGVSTGMPVQPNKDNWQRRLGF